MVLLLVFMQLTRDLFAIAKFLFELCCGQTNKQTDGLENPTHWSDLKSTMLAGA